MRLVVLSIIALSITAVFTVANAEGATLTTTQVVTDPKQIASKPDARVEKHLSIEKLYTTRQIGGSTWSPDGRTVAFICNMSGRDNLCLVASEGGWMT